MNTFQMIATMVSEGAVLPIDVATHLVDQGYDISSLSEALDGYSIEDLVTRYEELYG